MVGGVESQVGTVAFTYSAGARLVTIADGNDFNLIYNNATILKGTISDAVFDGATKHGLYAAVVGSVVNADNCVIWTRR